MAKKIEIKKKATSAVRKKIKEPKNTAIKLSSTLVSSPKLRPAKTKSPLPSGGRAKVENRERKSIGYFAASSVVMILGLLLLTQTELKDEGGALGIPGQLAGVSAQNMESHPVVPAIEKLDPIAQKTTSGTLAEEFKLAVLLNTSERIKFWSAYIEGGKAHQAEVANLVKGITIEDVAPIIPKKYDCTTFVETVAALSQSSESDQFIAHLIAIRYKDGAANFYARNHMPESDWIPNNQQAGILKDITTEVAAAHGLAPQFARKEIDRNKFLTSRARKEGISRNLASTNERAAELPVQAQVPYISVKQLKGLIDGIPDGTVINLVHAADNRHPGLIGHQGFLIRNGKQVFIRHSSLYGRIRSSELFSYLSEQQQLASRWPVVGINLNQFNDSSSSTKRLSEAM